MAVMGDEALVGRVLDGRYLVGERIARGGMASVFKATDQRLGREVAVKVMHHGLGDDATFTQRFEREAQAAAQLNHRHVVSVFDYREVGSHRLLILELLPGGSFADKCRGPMTVESGLRSVSAKRNQAVVASAATRASATLAMLS